MAVTGEESLISPYCKTHKIYFVTQTVLRVLAMATTLAAAFLTISNKETSVIFGIQADARYSYSPALRSFAFANFVAFALSALSLVFAFILGKNAVDSIYYFFLFLHDLVVTVFLMAESAATLTIGYLAKFGDSHTGWMAICNQFEKFCNRGMAAAILGFLGVIIYLILTIFSAKMLRQIQA